MISTDFAPNESWDDAFLSLKLLFQPWKWKKGGNVTEAKNKILELLNVSRSTFHVSLFLTGRSALYHLLKSLNLPKSSEILIQAFTCEAVVLPILANDLKPVYIDIETKTFSMDPIDLGKKISAKCKVLILQHTYGLTPDKRSEILELVKKHNLVLIEDIAHGAQISNFKFQISNSYLLMSFGRSKALSSVFGGGIVGPNNPTMQQLNNITNKLQFPSYGFILRLLLYKPLAVLIKSTYDFFVGKLLHRLLVSSDLLVPEITRKEKRGEFEPLLDKAYPNALAILLNKQISKYTNMQKSRVEACKVYSDYFKNVILNPAKRGEGSLASPTKLAERSGTNASSDIRRGFFTSFRMTNQSLIRFPILLNNRDEIIAKARNQNIFLGKWYDQVVAPKGLDLEKLEYKKGSCPVAEETCEKIINLPTNILANNTNKIIKFIHKYL